MDNKIKRDILRILANAPALALKNYLQTLNENDKAEAIRLIKALKINID